MLSRPLEVSIPEVARDSDAAVSLPPSVSVNDAASALCRAVEEFHGVTWQVKGRRTDRAVKSEVGRDMGREDMNGASTEGVDLCRDLI